jgi:hypothetical protein
MRAFMPSTNPADDVQREILEEDANTCLKVFDALSLNSDGARRARDMLQNLRDIKVPDERPFDIGVPSESSQQTATHNGGTEWEREGERSPMGSDDSPSFSALANNPDTLDDRFPINFAAMWNRQDWPSEIAESMAWSSQFVDAWDPLELTTDHA